MPTAVDDSAHRDQHSEVARACARLVESHASTSRSDLCILTVAVGRSLPGVASLGVLALLVLTSTA